LIAVEQGYAEAQYSYGLSLFYSNESILPQQYIEKAAAQGHPAAQNWLAYVYTKPQALDLWRKAATQGHIEAQYQLAECYYYGRGVATNHATALTWYEKAAQQGDANAEYALGRCYQYGHGVRQDYKKAFEWYTKSKLPCPDVLYPLGMLYY